MTTNIFSGERLNRNELIPLFFSALSLTAGLMDMEGCFFYVVIVGIWHFILIAIAAIVLAIYKALRPKIRFARAITLFTLFNFHLLFWGMMGDFLWRMIISDKLYSDNDPCVEFTPFVTPTIDTEFGDKLINGTTWLDMYASWFFIALSVWTFTIITYRQTKPWLTKKLLF